MRRLIAAALALMTFAGVAEAKDTLTIYTYDGFTSDWGTGPKVKAAFEKQCDCTIDFVALPDGVALLNRLKLEGDISPWCSTATSSRPISSGASRNWWRSPGRRKS
jgi:ABC-type thiamine transport system substrate-binding protein